MKKMFLHGCLCLNSIFLITSCGRNSDNKSQIPFKKTHNCQIRLDQNCEENKNDLLAKNFKLLETTHIAYLSSKDNSVLLGSAIDENGKSNYGGVNASELVPFKINIKTSNIEFKLDNLKVKYVDNENNDYCKQFSFKIENVKDQITINLDSPKIELYSALKTATNCKYAAYSNNTKLANINILFNKPFIDWYLQSINSSKKLLSEAEKTARSIGREFDFVDKLKKEHLITQLNELKENKTRLELISYNIKDLSPLSGFIFLEKLILTYNSIETIPFGLFSNSIRLKSLDLNNNKITIIEPATFLGLDNLEELNLSGNYFESIAENAFTNLKSLIRFSISPSTSLNNKLSKNIFDNLEKLDDNSKKAIQEFLNPAKEDDYTKNKPKENI